MAGVVKGPSGGGAIASAAQLAMAVGPCGGGFLGRRRCSTEPNAGPRRFDWAPVAMWQNRLLCGCPGDRKCEPSPAFTPGERAKHRCGET